MPNNLTGTNISDTYQRLLQIQGGVLTDGTGSIITVPSASYAISASHEITYEVSSSHSETSDTATLATNLTGLNISVAELNFLDGLSSADANIVLNANQNVRTADAPSFKNLLITSPMNSVGTPAIDLPTGAVAAIPHFQTNDGGPSLSIGDRGGSNIAIFGNSNDDAFYITQEGVFTGASTTSTLAQTATLATSITATANNSGDETVYLTFVDGATGGQGIETDTGLTYNPSRGTLLSTQISATHVTASGNISSSGNIYGSQYYTAGNTLGLYHAGTSTIRLAADTKATRIYGTNINLDAPVTASGDISASGLIYDSTLHQWETTARADTDNDDNWQGPNSYGIHTRADWNNDYGTLYSTASADTTIPASRLLMNTGWRIPHSANYSCSIKSFDVYVEHNTNQNSINADSVFSCSLWYSKNSDLTGELNVLGGTSGTFTQRHAATINSLQFKPAGSSLFKYNNYYVSQSSLNLNLAPGSMIYPRIKTEGTHKFTTNVYWIVNYTKIPL